MYSLQMESGIMTIASFISPYQRDRDLVRSRMPTGDFIEVYMNVRAACLPIIVKML